MNISFLISPYWHYLFDLLAFGFGARYVAFNFKFFYPDRRTVYDDPWYWRSLTIGAILGALLVGSSESLDQVNNKNLVSWIKSIQLGHSLSGALLGGVIAVELYKLKNKKYGSTGFIFVLPLLGGTFIGRWGCFLSGLADRTYGIESFGLGFDIGDGINRHPVALYESFTCLGLFFGFSIWFRSHPNSFRRLAFYLYILLYSLQRFIWEFFKPYKKIGSLPLNMFQLIAVFMVLYSFWMIRGNQRGPE